MAAFGPGGGDPQVAAVAPGFDAPFFQAGLAGYSDAAMRIVARRHGCPYCVTEALLDQTLLAGGRGFAKADLGEIENNIPGGEEDRPLAGQIMGSDPGEMAAAAIKMVEQGARREKDYRALARRSNEATERQADGEATRGERRGGSSTSSGLSVSQRAFAAIDINLACPVKKIARRARGGHWLAEPAGAILILEAVREALPREIPVTVKMRRSFDDTEEMRENFFRIFDAAYDMGCAWVTVHARSVRQKYIGPSRWDLLRDIVQRAHPGRVRERMIFGSGDVWEAADVFRMIAYCSTPGNSAKGGRHPAAREDGSLPPSCGVRGVASGGPAFDPGRPHLSGVSIARGCIGNPWIFRQCRDILAGREPSKPTIAEQRDVLMQHFELAIRVNRLFTRGLGEAREERAERHTARTMRKFGIRFAEHHPQGHAVRRRFIACQTMEEWRAVLEQFYDPETEL